MILKCSSFDEMRQFILRGKYKIVMFGAGVVGQVTVPEILASYGLVPYIDCYIDNDDKKWNDDIEILGRKLKINSPAYLKGCAKDTVLLINISRFAEILRQLEAMECTKNMAAYIMPMMCIHNFCSESSEGEPVLLRKPAIPKKIHYMWFGGKKLPDSLQRCMDSWKKYCPDYEIIRWDEDNYDIRKNDYMRAAYDEGAFGFIPDYARLDILYQYGGIYMDTDIELIRNIDSLLCQEAFCGVEKWQVINFGGCSGAVKKHPMIEKFIREREGICFFDASGNQNRMTCGFYDTKTALKSGYKINGKTQCVGGMNIYAYDYFHPYDYMSRRTNITEHTYSIHQFSGGWLEESMRAANEQTAKQYDDIYRMCLANTV